MNAINIKLSPTYASMSPSQIYDAIWTLVSVHQTFYLRDCLSSHVEGDAAFRKWASRMEESVTTEVNRLLADLTSRADLDHRGIEYRDLCIAMASHLIVGPRKFRVVVESEAPTEPLSSPEPFDRIKAIDNLTDAEDRCEGLLLMAQGIDHRSHSAALERAVGDVLGLVMGAKKALEEEHDGRQQHG